MCILLINTKAMFILAGVFVLIVPSFLTHLLQLIYVERTRIKYSKDRNLISVRSSSLSRWNPCTKIS